MCLQYFQFICDIQLFAHHFHKKLLCSSKQVKCFLSKSVFDGVTTKPESFVINKFLILIRIFRIMHCRCCLWVLCNVMQY